jgi:hypothetical protein
MGCSGNPGEPCGSGAIIFHKEEEIELKRAVSNRGFILLSEIIAIKIVLDYFINSKDQELHKLLLVVLSFILNCQGFSSSLVDGWVILGPAIHIVILCS